METITLHSDNEINKYINTPIKVLDNGFVRLVDYMGSDQAVVDSARISYGRGTKPLSDNKKLINYLMYHSHTSPFESCEIQFHIKLPIFVARQLGRHRTANMNEYSARYSVLDNDYYVPEPNVIASQSASNKQGREKSDLGAYEASYTRTVIGDVAEGAYDAYISLLNQENKEGIDYNPNRKGIAKELARVVLSVNFYTQIYWKIDLHNLFHFLKLRLDEHAQYEIRVYAEAIAEIVKKWVPLSWSAFENYKLNSFTLSANTLTLLQYLGRYLFADFCKIPGYIGYREFGITDKEFEDLKKVLKW